ALGRPPPHIRVWRATDQPAHMFWLAVRAWIVTGAALALAAGRTLALGAVLGLAAWLVLPRGAATLSPAAVPARRVGWGANRELLAGTSSRNEAKIWLSSGCVHSTFAVSPGTTSPRGKFGRVKNAILSGGTSRSDCPRS